MRLSALLGAEVRTEAGDRVGRIFDVRGELTGSSLLVTGIVVGGTGLAERLGIGARSRRHRLRSRDAIAWEDVVRADARGVVVRDRVAD